MEPTVFYVGLYFLVSLLHLASSRVDNYNGWKNSPNVQYHIQTDEGEERYFKYQTKSGQYRKEKRLQDGTVVGTYGWVDPNGYLRLRDYIADNQGYRILKTKMIYVGGNSLTKDSTPGTFHTKYSPLPSVTFQLPFENQNHRFGGYIPPPTTNAYVSPNDNAYLPPYFRQPYESYATTTPASPSHLSPSVTYPSYYPSSTPVVEVYHHSASKLSTPLYSPSTSAPSVATIFSDPTPTPIAPYSTTPRPIAIHYVSTPSTPAHAHYSSISPSTKHTSSHTVPAIGIASSTTPPPPLPAVSGKFAYFDSNDNFITETEKNKVFFRYENKKDNFYNNKHFVDFNDDVQKYDGISTFQNGFRYYLPRQYHEEKISHNGQERTGSFGYIDPFGIRRVIYYNTAPGGGFIHRKNNRYVGFDATPYDPRPSF